MPRRRCSFDLNFSFINNNEQSLSKMPVIMTDIFLTKWKTHYIVNFSGIFLAKSFFVIILLIKVKESHHNDLNCGDQSNAEKSVLIYR